MRRTRRALHDATRCPANVDEGAAPSGDTKHGSIAGAVWRAAVAHTSGDDDTGQRGEVKLKLGKMEMQLWIGHQYLKRDHMFTTMRQLAQRDAYISHLRAELCIQI